MSLYLIGVIIAFIILTVIVCLEIKEKKEVQGEVVVTLGEICLVILGILSSWIMVTLALLYFLDDQLKILNLSKPLFTIKGKNK